MSRAQVVKFCDDNDVTLFDESEPGHTVNITLWTPRGKVWAVNGCHVIPVYSSTPEKAWAWRELLRDARYGIEDGCPTMAAQGWCDACDEQEEA